MFSVLHVLASRVHWEVVFWRRERRRRRRRTSSGCCWYWLKLDIIYCIPVYIISETGCVNSPYNVVVFIWWDDGAGTSRCKCCETLGRGVGVCWYLFRRVWSVKARRGVREHGPWTQVFHLQCGQVVHVVPETQGGFASWKNNWVLPVVQWMNQ